MRRAAPLQSPPSAPSGDAVALDDAVARVRELSLRLWAVREAHPPRRGLLGGLRCTCCGHAWPCPTQRAAGAALAP